MKSSRSPPQQGIRAAFSYITGSGGGYTEWEVLPAFAVDPSRGSLFAFSSHQSRMGLLWITPKGAVATKHFSEGWGPVQIIAGEQKGASGDITVIDCCPSTIDVYYEVAWTRKNRTIGSARLTGAKDNKPEKWIVQTLVSDVRLGEGTLASVLENGDFVTLIYPGEDQSKVLFGNWLEAGTSPSVAQPNLIQNSPAFRLHLDVTLQCYHQVVAVSQASINATLKYHFDNDSKLGRFAYQDKPGEEWDIKITGTLASPTVTLLDKENSLDEALFYLNFATGEYQQFGRAITKLPMAEWSIPFTVSFGQVKLNHTPEDIRYRESWFLLWHATFNRLRYGRHIQLFVGEEPYTKFGQPSEGYLESRYRSVYLGPAKEEWIA